MSPYRTIVVPYDFSAHARAALVEATGLARSLGSDVHLVHVIETPAYAFGYGAFGGAAVPPPLEMTGIRKAAQESLDAVAAGIEDLPGKVGSHIVEGSGVADMIRQSTKDLGADLVVMGTHGRTGLAHVFLGSVAERTLRRAECAVLTVQSPEEDPADAGGER